MSPGISTGLERRGLVVRVADPEDQRARLIELTPDGKAVPDRYPRTLLGWFVDDLTARLAVVDE